ncbi:KfrB domain-containing protein [Pseudoduganella lurida]|uniref:KfrB domain-containing protein n=1 Tax=Pseudoduganella lurida TaxID=1036180 RepID=UPI0011A7853C|nr:KfrB domain-containing protein [Pseudoduganella lurida]
MKQRLLVMNGQRLLQTEKDGDWVVSKVDKAGAIKPGLYPLNGARGADRAATHEGVILHVDREHVFQLVGKDVVAHDASDFAKPPQAGSLASIGYQGKQASVKQPSLKTGRGVKR